MNATERARRSDSLYYDTQVTNRRALCDMIANLESDLEDAKAENAKLRELLRDTLTTISWCTIDCCPSDSKKRELNARACELGIELNDYE